MSDINDLDRAAMRRITRRASDEDVDPAELVDLLVVSVVGTVTAALTQVIDRDTVRAMIRAAVAVAARHSECNEDPCLYVDDIAAVFRPTFDEETAGALASLTAPMFGMMQASADELFTMLTRIGFDIGEPLTAPPAGATVDV